MVRVRLAVLVLLVLPAPAGAALLDEHVSFTVDGVEGATGAVAVGDVDGDGHGDLVIDEDGGRRFHLKLSGRADPVRIRGIVNTPPLPAGDVDGDGIDDLAVPSVEIDRPGVIVAVLRGRRTWEDVNLEHSAERDISVRVVQTTPGIGQNDASVQAAGDVNGDGIGDLALTVGSWDTLDRSGAPATAWVLFGRRGLRGSFDVRRLGSAGFAIRGGRTDIGLGESVAPAGDVDGDGLGDLLLGAPVSTPRGVTNATGEDARGRAFLVYGRRATTPIDVNRGAGAVTRIVTSRLAALGSGLAGPGDLNGDGLADIAVGAPLLRGAPGPRVGGAFVLPGARARPATIDIETVGAGALLRMSGVIANERLGDVLQPAGDVDGDGRPDLLAGTTGLSPGDAPDGVPAVPFPSALYVIHAGRVPPAFAPATVGTGVTVWSAATDEGFGGPIAVGSDLDRDGAAEIVVPVAQCGRAGGTRLLALEPHAPLPPRPAGLGTPGPDALRGGAGRDRLVGQEGDDVLEGRGDADCLVGGAGADVLRGGPARDVLHGDDGADRLEGGTGHDVLWGGPGDDVLLTGAADRGLAHGQTGLGGPGDDRIFGGPGSDELTGSEGDDLLVAGDGRDRLDGSDGADRLDGGRGDDALDGGPGRDTIRAGAGNDTIMAWDGETDTVACGPGRDSVVADASDRVTGCERRRNEPRPAAGR
jgi:Ca2+-binding RTX toxin-like protein